MTNFVDTPTRHPECREGSADRDFSPAAQNDEFDTLANLLICLKTRPNAKTANIPSPSAQPIQSPRIP